MEMSKMRKANDIIPVALRRRQTGRTAVHARRAVGIHRQARGRAKRARRRRDLRAHRGRAKVSTVARALGGHARARRTVIPGFTGSDNCRQSGRIAERARIAHSPGACAVDWTIGALGTHNWRRAAERAVGRRRAVARVEGEARAVRVCAGRRAYVERYQIMRAVSARRANGLTRAANRAIIGRHALVLRGRGRAGPAIVAARARSARPR